MKSLNSIVSLIALALLAGCATSSKLAVSVSQPVGPAPDQTPAPQHTGVLQVFSARPQADTNPNMQEFFWNDDLASNYYPHLPAHTDYTIYTRYGKLLQHVRNADSPNDDTPAVVTLPPGTYQIQAQAKGYDPAPVPVSIPVVIRPGQTTTVHLDGEWTPDRPYTEPEVVRAPTGQIVGWRAAQPS